MNTLVIILIIVGIITALRFYTNKRKRIRGYRLPANARELLNAHVAFYGRLGDKDKLAFEERIRYFLAQVSITGIGVQVEDIDRLLVASGAIIPIFSFPDWRYNNISEVLLYKDSFNDHYQSEGAGRNILGMVGDGALHRQMILSQPSLRASFANDEDGRNTAIHEFVHLLDKADGATDGIPEYLLARPYILPWVKQIHNTMQNMRAGKDRDIDFYGATNDAEFFAVVSEYFFERPDKLKAHHPELYRLLDQMFHP